MVKGAKLVLPALALTLAPVAACSVVTSHSGTVSGMIGYRGGGDAISCGDCLHPVQGTVRFLSGGSVTRAVRTGRHGRFSVTLRPGRYLVAADPVCNAATTVRVTAGGSDHVQLACRWALG